MSDDLKKIRTSLIHDADVPQLIAAAKKGHVDDVSPLAYVTGLQKQSAYADVLKYHQLIDTHWPLQDSLGLMAILIMHLQRPLSVFVVNGLDCDLTYKSHLKVHGYRTSQPVSYDIVATKAGSSTTVPVVDRIPARSNGMLNPLWHKGQPADEQFILKPHVSAGVYGVQNDRFLFVPTYGAAGVFQLSGSDRSVMPNDLTIGYSNPIASDASCAVSVDSQPDMQKFFNKRVDGGNNVRGADVATGANVVAYCALFSKRIENNVLTVYVTAK